MPDWIKGHQDGARREAWLRAAAWFDEEHRRECMVPHDKGHPESYAEIARAERRAVLGETAAVLRSWAENGTEPPHRPTREQWRTDFEKSR